MGKKGIHNFQIYLNELKVKYMKNTAYEVIFKFVYWVHCKSPCSVYRNLKFFHASTFPKNWAENSAPSNSGFIVYPPVGATRCHRCVVEIQMGAIKIVLKLNRHSVKTQHSL